MELILNDVREGTDPEKAKEWNELEITFTWEAGEPALNTGTVTVSYHPVTDDVSKMTALCQRPHQRCDHDRRLHHDAAVPVRDQPARLQYRTGHHEYLGGIWLLHHRAYSGPDAPDDMMTPEPGSRVGHSGSNFCQLLPRIPGLYHCKLCISGCARLCLHHRRRAHPGAGLSRGVHELRLGRPIA